MERLKKWRGTLTFTQRNQWCTGLAIGFIVGILGARVLFQNISVMIVFILLLTALLIITQLFLFRCPHCNAYLNRLSASAEYCPHCGKRFEH